MSKRTEKHYQIALLAATTSLEKQEIARRVGVHPNTVTRTLKLPEVRALTAELRQQTQNAAVAAVETAVKTLAERMDEAAGDAFQRLTELVRGARSETVQLKAVESILDRSTTAPKREIHSSRTVDVEQRVIHIHITPEQMAQLRQGYIEEEPDDMIDVTPQPVRPVREALAELEAGAFER
jgi:transposase